MAALSIQEQLKRPTIVYVEGKVQGYLVAASIDATAWAIGDVIQQLFKALVFALWSFTGLITAATRAGFLDTALDSTDPGGDPNGPDWLSLKGSGDFGTERQGEAFATTLIHIHNGSAVTVPIHVGDSVQNAVTSKTYRFEDDGVHFVAGVYNLAPQAGGDYTALPVIADEIGPGGSAAANNITILSSVILGVTVTNPSAALGTVTEDPDVYRERCREAGAATSPNGPADAYLYLARTLPGGAPLLRIADGAPVSITRAQLVGSKPVGTLRAWFADPDGGADAGTGGDVDTANANIIKYAEPVTDTYVGLPATDVPVNVTCTARIKAGPGIVKAEVEDLIKAAIAAYFPGKDIGGDDRSAAGAGVIYTSDFIGLIMGAKAGIYDPVVSTPGGSTTALAVGHVATAGTIAATVAVV